MLLLFLRSHFSPEVSEESMTWIFISGYIGGYFGARLFSLLLEQSSSIDSVLTFVEYLFSFGPMTLYGGVLGAMIFSSVACIYLRLPILSVGDIAVVSAFFGVGWGRIGCFLNGDDYGRMVDPVFAHAWWATVFPNLQDGIPRYPVQIFEALWVWFIVFLSYMRLRNQSVRIPGHLAVDALFLYGAGRFLLEYLRGDPGRGSVFSGMLSTSQAISLVLMLICFYLRTGPRLNRKL